MIDHVSTSKFLSLVLRHKPEEIGLSLDENGWTDLDELIRLANGKGKKLSRSLVEEVVANSDKQRFALDPSGTRIRANQGHSVQVALELSPQQPPETLFHGTATRFLDAIRTSGLLKMQRHHVHLSADQVTATSVGQRHGRVVILTVRAGDMWRDGHTFYRSANGVWLTDAVPTAFIDFPG